MARLSTDRFRHDAVRDTHWVGKGVANPWLVVLAIVALAAIGAAIFR